MKKTRIYHSETPAEELTVELAKGRRFTAVIALSASVYDEASGLYTITETADNAPHLATYGAIVEAIIALRYSTGAEIALNRADDADSEKQAYLAFVDLAKAAAKRAIAPEAH